MAQAVQLAALHGATAADRALGQDAAADQFAAPAPPPLDARLEHLLRRMRLPHMRRIAPEVLATAKAQPWDLAEVVLILLAGKSPGGTALRWPPAHPGGPSPPQDLRRLGRAPVIDPGADSGRAAHPGMDHQAREPGGLRPARHRQDIPARSHQPGRRRSGKHVAWFSLEQLSVLIREHRADDSVTKAITRILRADLVVFDDIGLMPVGPDATEGLYRLVDAD